jgi:hypothetical protein
MKRTLEMAREAGLLPILNEDAFQKWELEKTKKVLKRFEALVRADEREACAKVCEKIAEGDPSDPNNNVAEYTIYGIAMECVDAIRARGRDAA